MLGNYREVFLKIEQGDLAYVKEFIIDAKSKGIDLKQIKDQRHPRKYSLLYTAVKENQFDIMVDLIASGIPPEENWNDALRLAVMDKKEAFVKELLSHPGVAQTVAGDVDKLDDYNIFKDSLLYYNFNIVKMLMENPSIQLQIQKNGDVPYYIDNIFKSAAYDIKIDVLKYLLEYPVFKTFLKHGLNITIAHSAGYQELKALDVLLAHSDIVNHLTANQNAILRNLAIDNFEGNLPAIKKLLAVKVVRQFEIENPSHSKLTALAKQMDSNKISDFWKSNLAKTVVLGTLAAGTLFSALSLAVNILAAGAITLGAMAVFGLRIALKKHAFQEYKKKSKQELRAITPEQKEAFKQGVRSTTSNWEFFVRSPNPFITPAANAHWKAYYAGLMAKEVKAGKLIKAVRKIR